MECQRGRRAEGKEYVSPSAEGDMNAGLDKRKEEIYLFGSENRNMSFPIQYYLKVTIIKKLPLKREGILDFVSFLQQFSPFKNN